MNPSQVPNSRLDIKYQIFVSSPFVEEEARNAVFNAIHITGHLPMLLEKQTSSSNSSMSLIKTQINSSQIYILILGAYYGSIHGNFDDPDAISYTEIEYDIAFKSDAKVLVFMQNEKEIKEKRQQFDINNILEKQEKLNEQKLENFHKKVADHGTLISQWSKDDLVDFSAKVTSAIKDEVTILSQAAVPKGWIKASMIKQQEIITQSIENQILVEIVQRINEFNKLDLRCSEEKDSKIAIAKTFKNVFGKRIVDDEIDLYLDSGSTVAYVARELGKGIKNEMKIDGDRVPAINISTNNSLAYLHLWLKNQIPCSMFPTDSPVEPYGASYGPISKYGRDELGKEMVPDYGRVGLSEDEEIRIQQLVETFSRPATHESKKMLIVGAISGIQINDEPNLILPSTLDKTNSDEFTKDVSKCRGFHVGDYFNMLFKRYLYKTNNPIIICLNIEKVNSPIKVGVCHFIFDKSYSWDNFTKEHPLAFCIGYPFSRENDVIKNFKETLGFKLLRSKKQHSQHQAIIAFNDKFISSLGLNKFDEFNQIM